MALINCLECGQKISDKAKNCPNCGWKVVKDSSVDFYGNKIKSKNTVNNPVKKKNYSYENKSTKVSGSIGPGLIRAYKLRQQDNGWGYAFAHLIPIVPIYYAITRRTITPYLIFFSVSFVSIVFTLMISAALGEVVPNNSLTISRRLFMIASTPFITKFGINKARKYAKLRLEKIDSTENNFIR